MNKDVVERWETLGFLEGVEEEYKKYLADLYQSLANTLMNEYDNYSWDGIKQNISYDMWGKNPDFKDFISTALFAVLRKCFTEDNSITFLEFMDGLLGTVLSPNVIDENNNDDIDYEAIMCGKWANGISEYVKERKN